jgi:hypothetical protein
MVFGAEYAVGGVQSDPTGTWQVGFRPCMERSFGPFFFCIEFAEETAGESGGNSQSPQFADE